MAWRVFTDTPRKKYPLTVLHTLSNEPTSPHEFPIDDLRLCQIVEHARPLLPAQPLEVRALHPSFASPEPVLRGAEQAADLFSRRVFEENSHPGLSPAPRLAALDAQIFDAVPGDAELLHQPRDLPAGEVRLLALRRHVQSHGLFLWRSAFFFFSAASIASHE